MMHDRNGPTAPEPLQSWLQQAVMRAASDVHLVAGYPATLRVHGQLDPLSGSAVEGDALLEWLSPLSPSSKMSTFDKGTDADFAAEIVVDGVLRRLRVNLFRAGGRIGACLRIIPDEIPGFHWAGFPADIAERLAHFRNGLVLVCGVTGSGKTTTLAMVTNLLNAEGKSRIITVEEPIEYVYPRIPGSVISQREVGVDVGSFADGLKYGLRQDPDVLLVGEIRDRETAQMALSAAETGHVVFSTLHTRDAKGAISRFADLFPQDVQNEIRAQLATSLRAIVSQHLLPSAAAGEKRHLALEILFNNSPIASGIRTGKLHSLENYILSGRDEGMLNLEESVRRLFHAEKISLETAEHYIDVGTVW